MAVSDTVLLGGLLWMLVWNTACDTGPQAEEVELFHSDQQTTEGWGTSEPRREWVEVQMRTSSQSPVLVLQACGKRVKRTILGRWVERGDAHYILMDIAFAQEEESSGQLGPLQVHLFDSDVPLQRFREGPAVLDLQTTSPFPDSINQNHVSDHLSHRVALSLGAVTHKGFQLAFSYSGTCVLLTSIRLYYRRCPGSVLNLVLFGGAGAGSGPLQGSCVEGAEELSPPVGECHEDGVWGLLQGECTCGPGHQIMDDACRACRVGHFKAANGTAGCQPCPANSRTHAEGSVRCDCLPGFSRLPSDPHDLGCTKPPSAPVNVTARHHGDSMLVVTWERPVDPGGRPDMTFHIKCEKEAETGGPWETCGDHVVFLPGSAGLTNTSVSITGLDPQWDYRLSVQAWNDISSLQGAPHSSTTAVTIHRWKLNPVVITLMPEFSLAKDEPAAAPQTSHRSMLWLVIGAVFASLLLMTFIPIVVCSVRRNYTKLRSNQEIQLLPMNAETSYRRPETADEAPPEPHMTEGVVRLLEGVSDTLLASLRDVLVERSQLTLGKILGKGEFGSVLEGIFSPEEGMDTHVAVKTMRVGIHSQEDLHAFLREAEIMKNFDHKNVVGLLGVTLEREQECPLPVPLVILPYMKHGDLRRFLIATRYGDVPMFVPHQSLLRFMIDIAVGMDYLNSQGFLHRDLAARNCMLGDDLRVCVADFGLSKEIYSSNYYRQKVAIRVPIKWMAMESLSESIYTIKSDVWSFGVTMWEIISRGRTPYPGVHNHELLDLLQSGHRLKPPEDCDDKLYKVMKSCWDKDAACRPGFRVLAETLIGLLSELPVLEASQEASYINQGLQVAAATSAWQNPETDLGKREGNIYLPSPVGVGAAAPAAAAEDAAEDDGYLKYFTESTNN